MLKYSLSRVKNGMPVRISMDKCHAPSATILCTLCRLILIVLGLKILNNVFQSVFYVAIFTFFQCPNYRPFFCRSKFDLLWSSDLSNTSNPERDANWLGSESTRDLKKADSKSASKSASFDSLGLDGVIWIGGTKWGWENSPSSWELTIKGAENCIIMFFE